MKLFSFPISEKLGSEKLRGAAIAFLPEPSAFESSKYQMFQVEILERKKLVEVEQNMSGITIKGILQFVESKGIELKALLRVCRFEIVSRPMWPLMCRLLCIEIHSQLHTHLDLIQCDVPYHSWQLCTIF